MTKQQLMVELKARGIAFKPTQKKEELEALLASSEAVPTSVAQSEDGAASSDLSDMPTQWRVHDHKGRPVRTYTVMVHGAGAALLAEQFAGKIGGTIQELKD